MKTKFIIATLMAATISYGAQIDSTLDNWNVIMFSDLASWDYNDDQQTGQPDGDIVGDSNAPAFYSAFDDAGTEDLTDGTLYFRTRVGANAKTYWENMLYVGLDADGNGTFDLFAGLYKNNDIVLCYPGDGLNDAPNTTSIKVKTDYSYTVTIDNYSFMAVTSENSMGQTTDVDGDLNTDYFVSFSVPFADIVSMLSVSSISIDQDSYMSFLVATATQANSLNQDVGGLSQADINSSTSWTELGVTSPPTTATGDVVPEPATLTLAVLFGGMALFIRRFLVM